LIEWLALARKHAGYGSGDGLDFLLDGVLVAGVFVYPVLPQANVAAFLELVIDHVLYQVVSGFRRALRPECGRGTEQQ
jgi:hypothetical protein